MNAPEPTLLARCRARAQATRGSLGPQDLVALHLEHGLTAADRARLAMPDDQRPYGRRVLFAGEGLEVMVATWTRGVSCAPHDHGGAFGAVQVLQGRARHRIWTVQDGALRLLKEHTAGPGDLLTCGPDMIHSMGDDGDDAPLMTLHLYTPSIDFMVVYDTDGDETLVVDGDCGAWVPEAARVRSRAVGMMRRGDARLD
jgi:cysteine dioxygenase